MNRAQIEAEVRAAWDKLLAEEQRQAHRAAERVMRSAWLAATKAARLDELLGR